MFLSVLSATVPQICSGQTPDQPSYMSLVRQLGADRFAQREQAAKKLIQAGMAARPALMLGMKDEDLEVRLGAHRILVEVLQNDFDARIDAFVNDARADAGHDLPGWQLFQQQVGDQRPARELFAEMVRSDGDLLDALDRGDGSIEERCSNRIQLRISLATLPYGPVIGSSPRQSIPGATIATILFVSSQLQKSWGKDSVSNMGYNPVTNQVYTIMSLPAAQQTVLQDSHARLLQQLLSGWIEAQCESREQYGVNYALQLALKYDLREQAPRLARKILEDPHAPVNSVPYAAIVLGRFGSQEDAKYLLPHLKSTQVFHTWSNPQLKKEPIGIQVRDVILAMLIRLGGQSPESFGFELLEPYPETVYRIWTFGFLEDSQRDAAFAKWHTWSSEKAESPTRHDGIEGAERGADAEEESSVGK